MKTHWKVNIPRDASHSLVASDLPPVMQLWQNLGLPPEAPGYEGHAAR